MPLDRLLLIVFPALTAAGVTVWLGTVVASGAAVPFGALALMPALLVSCLVWRWVAGRVRDAGHDRWG